MRKYIFIIMAAAALWSALPQSSEAREIKDFFISMPDSLMPMLDENARKDAARMLDEEFGFSLGLTPEQASIYICDKLNIT